MAILDRDQVRVYKRSLPSVRSAMASLKVFAGVPGAFGDSKGDGRPIAQIKRDHHLYRNQALAACSGTQVPSGEHDHALRRVMIWFAASAPK